MTTLKHPASTARPLVMSAALICIGAAGCAGNSERPDEELARAETLIETAEQGGAREYADTTLGTARDKLERARDAAANNDFREAERLATEARLDAELAVAQTESGEARAALDEINNSIETLREEIMRGGTRR